MNKTAVRLLAAVVSGIAASFLDAQSGLEVRFETGASIALGVMFLIAALLCRLGAEQATAQAQA